MFLSTLALDLVLCLEDTINIFVFPRLPLYMLVHSSTWIWQLTDLISPISDSEVIQAWMFFSSWHNCVGSLIVITLNSCVDSLRVASKDVAKPLGPSPMSECESSGLQSCPEALTLACACTAQLIHMQREQAYEFIGLLLAPAAAIFKASRPDFFSQSLPLPMHMLASW